MIKKIFAVSLLGLAFSSNALEFEQLDINDANAVQQLRENLTSEQQAQFDYAINTQTRLAIFYKDRDYGNEYRIVLDNLKNFVDIGFNDAASSVKIINASGLILYRDRDYGGDYRIILGDESNFVNIGFNDAVSSMKFL